MTKEEFAKLLDGREYGEEMTEEEETLAAKNNLVIVFGYSDDGVIFKGSINDEAGAYDGAEIHIDAAGIMPECECKCECRKCDGGQPMFKTVFAHWDSQGYSWFMDIEHIEFATFEILEHTDEGTQKFCRGIVFNYSDL